MNRIDQLFKNKENNILSVYYPAGYPNLDNTLEILSALQKNGIDMVEIGIPFSDPMADGKIIQDATQIALKNGISLNLILQQLNSMRDQITIPVILMGYLNPIMQFGFEKLCAQCNKIGIDGIIIPDLPYNDYINKYKSIADKYNVHVIMLITPQTSIERVHLIDNNTNGFIYLVSGASITGPQNNFSEEKTKYFEKINSLKLKNRTLIGFGISNKETYESACCNSNGAIIGSHFVNLLSKNNINNAIKKLKDSIL